MLGQRRVVMWVPDWSIASLSISVPPGSPCITVQRGRVMAATRNVRKLGIHVGMKQSVAEHICNQLIVLPHDPLRDQSSFEVLLGIFDRHFANVNALQPGLAWANMPTYIKNEDQVIGAFQEAITEETSIECFFGVGNGVATAIAAAKRGKNIKPEQTKEFLTDISTKEILQALHLLGYDPQKNLEILSTFGVLKVEDIYRLGGKQLTNRFGKEGQALWSLANGQDAFFDEPSRTEEVVELIHEFDEPVQNVDHVALEIRGISERFVDRLIRRAFSAQSVEITLISDRGERYLRRWSLFDATNPANIMQRLKWQMRAWQDNHVLQTEGDEVDALSSLVIRGIGLISQGVTEPMWGGRSRSHLIEHTVAQVQVLVGEDSVKQPFLQPGMNPRERICMRSWNGTEKQSDQHEVQWGLWEGAILDAPLILFDRPLQAKLIGKQQEGVWGEVHVGPRGLLEGQPNRIIVLDSHPELDNVTHYVERIHSTFAQKGRWWSKQRQSLCYLRVITKEELDLLMVQKQEQWYVEGIYVNLTQADYPFGNV